MRILYVHNINRVAEIHARELARRNHFTNVYEPNLAGGLAPLPIKLMRMPERMLDLRHVIGDASSKHFDIMHIHWASYGVIGLTSRIPFIVECHGTDVRSRLRQPFFRSVLRLIFRRAAAVLCITPDLLPIVQSIRSDALFLPGPVDTQQFIPAKRDRLHPWTILLFTRLDPIKGPEVAIEGILRFTERHADISVRLLDWGTSKEKYKQCYGERFEFVSLVPPDQVQHLIWSADVIVGQLTLGILSFCELQAMSCGKPLICSFRYEKAYPAPPPLCQANTAEEVEEHLEHLFQHPELGIALGQQAREWVVANHSYQILSDKLEALYYSSIERGSALQS